VARIVIADAGPLIALAGINQLSLLHSLFPALHMTGSVRDECLAKPGNDTDRIQAAVDEGWLIVKTGHDNLPPLSPALGAGESDSIQLAMQAPKDTLLIMDDRLARRYALAKDLYIIGTVRLLDLAEKRGLIQSAEEAISDMKSNGYRISIDLLQRIRIVEDPS
jgi:predicted nucleic acid-binding protein